MREKPRNISNKSWRGQGKLITRGFSGGRRKNTLPRPVTRNKASVPSVQDEKNSLYKNGASLGSWTSASAGHFHKSSCSLFGFSEALAGDTCELDSAQFLVGLARVDPSALSHFLSLFRKGLEKPCLRYRMPLSSHKSSFNSGAWCLLKNANSPFSF